MRSARETWTAHSERAISDNSRRAKSFGRCVAREVSRVNVAKSECRLGRIVRQEWRGGVTLERAHEVFRRYFEMSQAVPTVATQLSIEYQTACDILDGKIWPQARQQWIDKVFP